MSYVRWSNEKASGKWYIYSSCAKGKPLAIATVKNDDYFETTHTLTNLRNNFYVEIQRIIELHGESFICEVPQYIEIYIKEHTNKNSIKN